MRTRLARRLLAAALALVAGNSFAAAGPDPEAPLEQTHVLGPGQNLAWVSERYYGTARWDSVLRRYNGLPSTAPPPATRVRIPRSKTQTAVPGDTWSALAERHWKRPFAAAAFARMNQRSLREPLQVGERVAVPILVPVELSRGQTLASVARELYRDPEFWPLLQSVNRIEQPHKLRPGTRILAPVVLEARALPESEESAADPQGRDTDPGRSLDAATGPDPERTRELEAGIRAYRQGQYAQALESLESARAEIMTRGSIAQQRSLLRHLGFSYVAYDLGNPACAAFRDFERVSPGIEWDPKLVSPKILTVLRGCQGL